MLFAYIVMLFLFFNLVNTESDHAALNLSMFKEKKKGVDSPDKSDLLALWLIRPLSS